MINRIAVFVTLLFVGTSANAGPFAPPAGQPGSTAIAHDDPKFVGWASDWKDGSYQTGSIAPDPFWQDPNRALGPALSGEAATLDVVSLGEGGEIILTFDDPIINGTGADFAVFENAFDDAFLELAYVGVSTDGVDFVNFISDSRTSNPVIGLGTIDTTDVDGLAGKYRAGFGTPFDLDVFTPFLASIVGEIPSFDLQNINYVRIRDVFGDGTMLDSFGKPIYDPYPTLVSIGFDLEAVGVINQGVGPSDPPPISQVPVPPLFILVQGLVVLLLSARKMASK